MGVDSNDHIKDLPFSEAEWAGAFLSTPSTITELISVSDDLSSVESWVDYECTTSSSGFKVKSESKKNKADSNFLCNFALLNKIKYY